MAVHKCAGERVEFGDVAAAERDHHVPGVVVAGGGPPVGEQSRLRRERCLGGDQSSFAFGEGEVVAAEAVADRLERAPLLEVMLAAVLAQLDGAVAFDNPGEEAAGADRGQLAGIADQDDLPVRLFDALEQRREDPRFGHVGLVDHDEAALGYLILEEAVECARGDAGFVLELLRGNDSTSHSSLDLRHKNRRRSNVE